MRTNREHDWKLFVKQQKEKGPDPGVYRPNFEAVAPKIRD